MPYSNSFSSKISPSPRARARTQRSSINPELTHVRVSRQNVGVYQARSAQVRKKALALPRLAFLLALGAALFGAGAYTVTALGSLAKATSAPRSSNPVSTPQNEWKAGAVPALYQRDTAWAQTTYGTDSFGVNGCGPTCLSMVYIGLTGKNDFLPTDASALSESLGFVSSVGTAWAFMTEGAASKGLIAEELPATESAVRQALRAGKPIICSLGPGDFTSTGHFIVLRDIDDQGNLLIRDPNSPERTEKTWQFSTVLPQCLNLWAYTQG